MVWFPDPLCYLHERIKPLADSEKALDLPTSKSKGFGCIASYIAMKLSVHFTKQW